MPRSRLDFRLAAEIVVAGMASGKLMSFDPVSGDAIAVVPSAHESEIRQIASQKSYLSGAGTRGPFFVSLCRSGRACLWDVRRLADEAPMKTWDGLSSGSEFAALFPTMSKRGCSIHLRLVSLPLFNAFDSNPAPCTVLMNVVVPNACSGLFVVWHEACYQHPRLHLRTLCSRHRC